MDGLDDLFDDAGLEITSEDGQAAVVIDDGELSIFGEGGETSHTESNPVIEELLKLRGIDSNKITIIDENDQSQELNFYDLSREEQLEILNYEQPSQENANDLNETEVDFLNHLRTNNLTLEQYLEQYKDSIVNSLSPQEVSYDIDAYNDEELYMLDLKNKYDLSDEELVKELEKELQDEALFKRKTDKLRSEYKELEDNYKETQKQEFARNQQEQYDAFAQQMVNIAIETPEFHGFELEDEEKNEVLSYLLELDDSGVSEFYKSLNDPKKLYEAAWFLRYGKESLEALNKAYESEIAKLQKNKDTDSKTVIRRNTPDNGNKANSIHDLF